MPKVAVQITENFDRLNVELPKLKKLVKAVCMRFCGQAATKYEVTIAIVDDAQIHQVNKRFLNHDGPTDCLSFDLSSDENQKSFELLVNAERAIAQAKLRGHCPEAELALYITHGLLHNLGFDDSTKTKAQKMHDAEDEILQQLGYGSVYNSRQEKQ